MAVPRSRKKQIPPALPSMIAGRSLAVFALLHIAQASWMPAHASRPALIAPRPRVSAYAYHAQKQTLQRSATTLQSRAATTLDRIKESVCWARRRAQQLFIVTAALAFAILFRTAPLHAAPALALDPPAVVVQHEQKQQAFLTPEGLSTASRLGAVTDKSGYFTVRQVASIRAQVRAAERLSGAQFCVVTVPSIGGRNPKRFATDAYNYWRIGHGQRASGVLVLIVRDVRRVEIAVGRQLNGVISHLWTEQMLGRNVLPHLKQGRVEEGTIRAIRAIADRLDARGMDGPEDASNNLLVPVTATCYAGFFGYKAYKDRRDRTCATCGKVVGRLLVGSFLGTDQISSWQTIEDATTEKEGTRSRELVCGKCGATSVQFDTIRAYDGRRRGRDGRWIYYYTSSSSSSSSSNGGGGGGGNF